MTADLDTFDVTPTEPVSPISADPRRDAAAGTAAGDTRAVPKKEEDGRPARSKSLPLSEEEIKTTVERLREQVESQTKRLEFDLETGEQILVVRDKETDEVVRTFPAEELRQLKERLDEFAAHLVDLVV